MTNTNTIEPLTADTITDDQIRALHCEAIAAGVERMVITCAIALRPIYVAPTDVTVERILRSEDNEMRRQARRMCARAINAARAAADSVR